MSLELLGTVLAVLPEVLVGRPELGVLVRLDTVPWLFGSSLVDNNVGSVGEAVADVGNTADDTRASENEEGSQSRVGLDEVNDSSHCVCFVWVVGGCGWVVVGLVVEGVDER